MRAHEFTNEEFLEVLNGDVLDHSSIAGHGFWQAFDDVIAKLKSAAVDAPMITSPAQPLQAVIGETARNGRPTLLPPEICDGSCQPASTVQDSTRVEWDPNDENGDDVVLVMEPWVNHPKHMLRRCRAARARGSAGSR